MRGSTFVLDTHAIIHRCYHALPPMTGPEGQATNALYGLSNILLRLIEEYEPKRIYACFDRPEPTFRHEKFAAYKAQRPKAADELISQLIEARKLLEAFGIPVLEMAGVEADDLIGSIVTTLKDRLLEPIVIVTGDLDTLQLVAGQHITVAIMQKGFREVAIYDQAAVEERYGIAPSLLPDLKALVGDHSDNIPGLPGIGPKRAADLIQRYGSLEELMRRIKFVREDKIRTVLENHRTQLELNKILTTINRTIHLALPEGEYAGIDLSRLQPILERLGFRSIIQRLENQTVAIPMTIEAVVYEKLSEAEAVAHLQEQTTYLPFLLSGDQIFCLTNKAYQMPATAKTLQALLSSHATKITFDLKEVFKKIFFLVPQFNVQPDLEKIIDLKLLVALVQSNLLLTNLEDLVMRYAPRTSRTPEGLRDQFLSQAVELTERLRGEGLRLKLEEVIKLEHQVAPVLARMELQGLRFSRPALEQFRNFLDKKIRLVEREVTQRLGVSCQLNSPRDLRRVLFEVLRLPTKGIAKTTKGAFSTQETELEKLRAVHPAIITILEYRTLTKLRSTYTDSLEQAIDQQTQRLHSTFEALGSTTGRISSRRPNLQNLPIRGVLAHGLRRCFEATPGFRFIGLDYSQIELRLAAHLSKDDNLILAFQGGLDVHAMTAKLLFKSADPEARRRAKTVNFGILYGMSAEGLKNRLHIPRTEAQAIIADYFKKFPGVAQFRQEVIERAQKYGYAETMLGRKRLLPEINSQSFRERAAAERAAINTPLQGWAADILKRALVRLDTALLEQAWYPHEARIVLQVYDQIILEAQEAIIEPVTKIARAAMEQAWSLSIPLTVSVKTGSDLSELSG